MISDIINGSFEMLAGLFVLNHCRVLLKDKEVKGVSVVSVMFMSLWGVWNLYYYPSLDQWWSFYGGLFIVAANFIWVTLLLSYNTPEMDKAKTSIGKNKQGFEHLYVSGNTSKQCKPLTPCFLDSDKRKIVVQFRNGRRATVDFDKVKPAL